MTRAVAATAAMILVERGLPDVDATVESIVPEFAGILVLDGRPIDRFCRDEIFAPLGMANSLFDLDEARTSAQPGVMPKLPDEQFMSLDCGPPKDPDVYSMGGALYTTPADYLRFLRVFLNDGTLDGPASWRPRPWKSCSGTRPARSR